MDNRFNQVRMGISHDVGRVVSEVGRVSYGIDGFGHDVDEVYHHTRRVPIMKNSLPVGVVLLTSQGNAKDQC